MSSSTLTTSTMPSAVVAYGLVVPPPAATKKGLKFTLGCDDPDYFNKMVAGRIIHRRRTLHGGAGKKPQPLLIQHQPNGDMELILPAGTPVDHANKMKSEIAQRASKSMMKHRLTIALAEREEAARKSKSETKVKAPETHAEMMVRYKAMCDLLGQDEASKMMDKDFWMD